MEIESIDSVRGAPGARQRSMYEQFAVQQEPAQAASPGLDLSSGSVQDQLKQLLAAIVRQLMKLLQQELGMLDQGGGAGDEGLGGSPGGAPCGATGAPVGGPAGAPGGAPAGGKPPAAPRGGPQPPASPAGPASAPTQAGGASPGAAGAGPTGAGAPSGVQPPDSINAKDLGVRGDGSTDDQAALQRAFDQAKASGKSVWLPAGTYNHSGVLNVDGVKVVGAGSDTVLKATNPDQEAVKLTGNGASLSNLTTQVAAPSRSSQPDAAAVLVQNASGASVSNVTTLGAASNGIRIDNSTGSNISNCLVQGSNADGIALMNGACDNKVQNCVVYQAGDDAYSSDSYGPSAGYQGDARQNSGNVFSNCLAKDTAYGRGFALMGSSGDTIENCTSDGTNWRGISTGTDETSKTMAGSGAILKNNTILNFNRNGATDSPIDLSGVSANENNQTSGNSQDPSSVLGWDAKLVDRSVFGAGYTPGTGDGANGR